MQPERSPGHRISEQEGGLPLYVVQRPPSQWVVVMLSKVGGNISGQFATAVLDLSGGNDWRWVIFQS